MGNSAFQTAARGASLQRLSILHECLWEVEPFLLKLVKLLISQPKITTLQQLETEI